MGEEYKICNKDGTCKRELRGEIVDSFYTGDPECNSRTYVFECGGVYNKNYMDKVGREEHLCFWNCKGCKW